MFDRRSYLDTISALRADPDKLEEIIKMKENDRRHIPHSLRPWPRWPPPWPCWASPWALSTPNRSRSSCTTSPPPFRWACSARTSPQRRGWTSPSTTCLRSAWRTGTAGRSSFWTGEETDITDALAQDGHYTFQQQSEGTVLDLTVTGSVQDWTLTCSVHGEGEEGPVYTYTGGGRIPPPSRWTRETRSPVWSRRSPRSRGSPPPRSPRPAEL